VSEDPKKANRQNRPERGERLATKANRQPSARRNPGSRTADQAAQTFWAAAPAASAPEVTPALLRKTTLVPSAASWVFALISRVAVPCSSTAAAMLVNRRPRLTLHRLVELADRRRDLTPIDIALQSIRSENCNLRGQSSPLSGCFWHIVTR
jgi:hypothetical protein